MLDMETINWIRSAPGAIFLAMRFLGCLAALVAGCSSSVSAPQAPAASTGADPTRPAEVHNAPLAGLPEPEAAVRAYFEASDKCSSHTLRTAFHPGTLMHWVDKTGALHTRPQLSWWQALETGPCNPALERKLTVVDREGAMALVEANSRFSTFRFHDFLLVANAGAGWRIVDKIFQRLEGDEVPAALDEEGIRRTLDVKIKSANTSDPALLAASHTEDAIYTTLHVNGVPFLRETLSEGAFRYATRRERGEGIRDDVWQVSAVGGSGTVAYAKLDVRVKGKRYIDFLLLLHTSEGWRISGAVWGDPSAI